MTKKTVAKKGVVKVDAQEQTHIHSSFNDIVITPTNSKGQVINWSSAGKMGSRSSRRNTPYAAQPTAQGYAKTAFDLGLHKVETYAKGPDNGREFTICTIHGVSIEVIEIIDATPLSRSGYRPPKRRKV